MSNCCDIENPLIRDGISQNQRQAKTLLPNSVKVDERKLADFLVFAHCLSEKVKYYTGENIHDGNWQDFFGCSTPVQIALIINQRPKTVQRDYAAQLKDGSKTGLLDIITGLLDTIRKWHAGLESYTPLKSAIKGLVSTNIREYLVEMWTIEYELRGEDKKAIYTNFSQEFHLKLSSKLEAVSSSPSSGSPATSSELGKKLETVFQVLFQTYNQIVQKAPQYLTHSLIARQDHQPHLSLYFAFLKILQPARDDLNRMTQRHLDFFYRDVLRLPKKPAEPDRAHLIFQLAKSPKKSYKLNSNTIFKAGKDASGVEIFYKLDQQIIVHKAQIASLKGLFLAGQKTDTGELTHLTGVHLSSTANSANGNGQDFSKELPVKAWLPFGNAKRPRAVLGLAIASDIFYLQESERTVIFTLTFDAEPEDLQEEDLPTIFTVDFSGKEKWIEGKIQEPGEAGQTHTSLSSDRKTVTLEVLLTAEQEPIISYHSALTGATLSTGNKTVDKPVARLRLKESNGNSVNNLSPCRYFHKLKLTNLEIKTDVAKVRNLLLQNDFSKLDNTKTYAPFGDRPTVGSKFYIGSQEIFRKKITDLKINLDWEGVPKQKDLIQEDAGSASSEHISTTYFKDRYRGYYVTGDPESPDYSQFTVKVERLYNNNWLPEDETLEFNLFFSVDEEENLVDGERDIVDKLDKIQPPDFLASSKIDSLSEFNSQTPDGFLRFTLQQDFLHEEFIRKYALQALALAKDQGEYVLDAVYQIDNNGTLSRYASDSNFSTTAKAISIKEPYTPVIQSLYLSYSAETDWRDCQMFYLHPFDGFAELKLDETTESVFFLPQFTNEGKLPEGELLIGLKDLEPPSALPLLFQVAEETADTDLEAVKVSWYFLQDNDWKELGGEQILSDTTNGLVNSGIVKLAIPADISKTKNTILDPSLYWIKASVSARSAAICQIVDVHTQAAQVTFTDKGNDPNHLATPLPANKITKLVEPKPEIKKVEQPYESFGGQVKEQAAHFYTRISEHLRHKGRAVTIFDYERLVLEKFPQIYKVRCINHGQLVEQQFQELVPGAVTLAVIPDLSQHLSQHLSQRKTTNDIEPKVNINLLHKIEKYLGELSSPWVKDAIRVVNPKYESIQVEFQVQFKEDYQPDFDYYSQELDRAIVSFLAPWTSNKGAEIYFEGKMYRSSILKLIEEQYYVDYVLDFKMYHEGQEVREAIASTPRSVLTSVSFSEQERRSHIIKEIPSKND